MMENLDLKCAEAGKQIAETSKAEERLINQALGVLEEQGVYAFFLFLKAQGKETGEKISNACLTFLNKCQIIPPLLEKGDDLWKKLQELGKDLDKLLFARDLLLQVLTYARYHVKSRAEESQ